MSSIEKELDLDLDLECSLCKDIFREPKTLGCLHSFCLECLEIHYEKAHSNIKLRCPICRTPFQSESREHLSNLSTDSYLLNALRIHNSLKNSVPEYDNQKLMCLDEENEATHYCLDCQDYLCEICEKAHQKIKTTKNHRLISIEKMKDENQINVISKSNSQVHCQIHHQKELDLLCDDCKEPICSLCVSKHPSHKILVLSDVVGNENQSLIDLINQVKPKEKELREGINKCKEVIKELEINSTTTQIQINQLFNKIRNKLDEKEQELLSKLEEIEKHRKKELEIQIEELRFGIESIIGSCQMIQNSISLSNNNKNDARLLSMKKLYQSRLNYLSNNIWKIEPCHHSLIEFLISKNEEQSIYSTISTIGVIDSNEISADKCLISRNDKQRIYENQEFKFEIISYSNEGNEVKKGGNEEKFIIHIEEELNNEKSDCEILDLNNGKYEVKMKLKNEGKYSIFVKFNGININSSPFQIQILPKQRNYNEINQPKLTFGSEGNGNGHFSNPYGIAINSNGDIIVCDSGSNRVQLFDSKGNFISMFGSEGNGNTQFRYPWGISINSKGNLIVCDSGNNRIQIFDSKRNFISAFGSSGNGNGQFSCPEGICVDKNDRIFVSDYSNNRIQIFDAKGQFISTFGSSGNGNGQFNGPVGIIVNSKGNILVCDNHKIQIFDSNGNFKSIKFQINQSMVIPSLSKSNQCNFKIKFSRDGITIDSKGNIIVCDFSNNRIQIFDCEGKFISTFGTKGNGNGQFNNPYGICVDLNDNIFVCDRDNSRIQIFDSNGEYITQFGVNKPTDIAIDPNTQNIIVCGDDNRVSIF